MKLNFHGVVSQWVWLGMLGLGVWLAPAAFAAEDHRPRVVVLTDLSNEPDDEESLVRFLVYANEFAVEGLIATTSTHLKSGPREDLLRRDLDAYEAVRTNLARHAPGYPTADQLRTVTKTGQAEYGMAAVGEGKSTEGSRQIIEVVDKADARPVWVSVWGGANTLAQALRDVQATRDAAAVERFVAKLRVYTISDQDDAGHWIRPQFPKLFYICSPGGVGGSDYWRATWNGISGDRRNKIGVMHRFAMVDNPWLEQHIIRDHGPLGALYPKLAYIMEGDTPAFLGLIDNGLGWAMRPDYGGWGGRYREFQPWGEQRKLWTDLSSEARDTVTSDDNGRTETSNHATIWRWREHFQNDFAARMDWCVADDFSKANHNPIAVLNGDRTKDVLNLMARPGEIVRLSAEGTSDPDGHVVEMKWWIYEEAGSLQDKKTRRFPADVKLTATTGAATSLTLPPVEKPAALHVILEVCDSGTPKLWAYRRAVITVQPAELRVHTDFEGGSARVEAVDQASRVIRLQPGGDPERGWPCWWSLRVEGVARGERLTLEVGGSDRPVRNNGEQTKKPLDAAWAMPGRAALSTDGTTWRQTEPGHRDGARMRYEVTGTGDPLWIAWGPPFTPHDTDVLLAEAERTLPEAKAFELGRSREGRPVRGLRVSAAAPGQAPAIWIQARQHAWESGASWVARGLVEWVTSTEADAIWLRQHAELFIVPIMDVDNVATGNGGKEENPRDHNRDWNESPVYPEVAAAQQRLLTLAEADRLALFVDLHNPAPGDLRPFFFTSSPDVLGELARRNQTTFLTLAAQTINGPLAVEPAARLTGPKYHPLWRQISNAWVNTHGNPHTVAVCLETSWNTPHSTTEGYRMVGRQLGQTVVEYLRRQPK